jgi:hypothetical protein
MSLVTAPVYYELTIHRGQNLQVPTFTIKDEEGNIVNLTGCVGEIAVGLTRESLVKEDSSLLLKVTSEDSSPPITLGGSAGTFTTNILEDDVNKLDPTGEDEDYEEYYWWARVIFSDGVTKEIMFEGPCQVV